MTVLGNQFKQNSRDRKGYVQDYDRFGDRKRGKAVMEKAMCRIMTVLEVTNGDTIAVTVMSICRIMTVSEVTIYKRQQYR